MITEEGSNFCERKRRADQLDKDKRSAAKRQKTENIDAKLTALLSDAEWLPLVSSLLTQNSCIHSRKHDYGHISVGDWRADER
jgi:hypothetical protein